VAETQPSRIAFDLTAYTRRVQRGPCFICATVAEHPDYFHHRVYEDTDTIAFLNRYPSLLGHCLVAPKRHLESWVDDLDEVEHVALQRVVHQVARAVEAVIPTERMYCLSLGSKQGNAHLHWHLAPLPPGVAYEEQQLQALGNENGVLNVDDARQEALAAAIRARFQGRYPCACVRR
jgi:diadenosine tetraphosphate (Ap4A) HIT family hydrolase